MKSITATAFLLTLTSILQVVTADCQSDYNSCVSAGVETAAQCNSALVACNIAHIHFDHKGDQGHWYCYSRVRVIESRAKVQREWRGGRPRLGMYIVKFFREETLELDNMNCTGNITNETGWQAVIIVPKQQGYESWSVQPSWPLWNLHLLRYVL